MLFAINNNASVTQIKTIPHEAQYRIWRSRLSDEEYNRIAIALNEKLNEKEIATAGWIPGSNWMNTPYWPIYDSACVRDQEAAAKCFGIIVWNLVMEHAADWSFGRYAVEETPIESMTYFRINRHG